MFKKIIIFALLGVLSPVFVSASLVEHTDRFKSEGTIKDNIYLYNKTPVEITTITEGDVSAFSMDTISIGTSSLRDVFAVAQRIFVANTNIEDFRLVGNAINIDSNVKGDVFAAGGEIMVSTSTVIGKDFMVAAGRVVVDGNIKGRSRIYATEVYINGSLEGGAIVRADKIVIGGNAVVLKNFIYQSSQQATFSQGSKVEGIKFEQIWGNTQTNRNTFSFTSLFVIFAMFFVSSLLLHAVLGGISASLVRGSAVSPFKKFGIGLLVFFATPLVVFLCFISIAGIFAGVVVGLLYIILIILGLILMPIVVGSSVYKWATKNIDVVVDWKTILIGSAIVAVIYRIPVLGFVVGGVILLLLLGSLVVQTVSLIKNSR